MKCIFTYELNIHRLKSIWILMNSQKYMDYNELSCLIFDLSIYMVRLKVRVK